MSSPLRLKSGFDPKNQSRLLIIRYGLFSGETLPPAFLFGLGRRLFLRLFVVMFIAVFFAMFLAAFRVVFMRLFALLFGGAVFVAAAARIPAAEIIRALCMPIKSHSEPILNDEARS